jgi:anti-anti-sigma factor
MTITSHEEAGDITILSVDGEIDLYNSARLKETVVELFGKDKRKFVVDLDGVSYLDSSGIGVLLYIYTSCRKRGLHVFFTNLHGEVAKVIALTKLDNFLPIASSVTSAVTRLNAVEAEGFGQEDVKQIRVDGKDPLFDTTDMYHKTFYIDLSQVRRLSNLIAQEAPKHIQEINMLEQQISEIIKNGVRHGNRNDRNKALKVWFSFSDHQARLIVEDEGEGFQQIEMWNEFYRKKIECYRNNDFEEMMNYLAFRTEDSTETDGGNAMFAAIEYWNGGLVFNDTRNAVAVRRLFHDE